ncbi:uncharacterized protein EI97DRAFT_499695 [Westerdykella ornata]|uniref:Mid2 domain-containing protein n=1 Tax=Westerdykella ornata TaxID=318751 RepID=A0A6A6JT70_WESOR|nr:uncharacterized protein EI97DRAFT_499695 [Westerdykella ornata]KAF2278189.1 hypothetical protein EI97DRAFT_499695 [Westerdykella ornata]
MDLLSLDPPPRYYLFHRTIKHNMKALLSEFAILPSASLPTHLDPRDEGRIWTTPQDSANGSFIFPRAYPLAFREGSNINISWSTKYENINLYFYQRGKVADSVQLVTNLATNWYQWEVRAQETNLTNPFVFRVVNAKGTAEERTNGGFWSTSWYLTRGGDTSQSVTLSSSTVSSTTAPSSTASLSGTTTAPTTGSSQTSGTHDNGFPKGAIIGLTIGLVLAAAIIVAGILYYLKQRRKRKDALSSVQVSDAAGYGDKTYSQMRYAHHPVHETFTQPSELHGEPPRHELPGSTRSEG